MLWNSCEEDEDENLRYSPALIARRASESWIDTLPLEDTSLAAQIQRKKSMPDFQGMPTNALPGISREEVSNLSSLRREEIRRLQEENERLRANPLLYLVSPQVCDWFSRQQLVILVLFVNVSLAIVFFKVLMASS